MDVTNTPPLSAAEGLRWLASVEGYARWQAGPPRLVRIMVVDPMSATDRVSCWRVVLDDDDEAVLLDAIREVKEGVESAQREGRFAFLTEGQKGWRDDRPGW